MQRRYMLTYLQNQVTLVTGAGPHRKSHDQEDELTPSPHMPLDWCMADPTAAGKAAGQPEFAA